jgi:hypothetical protein
LLSHGFKCNDCRHEIAPVNQAWGSHGRYDATGSIFSLPIIADFHCAARDLRYWYPPQDSQYLPIAQIARGSDMNKYQSSTHQVPVN